MITIFETVVTVFYIIFCEVLMFSGNNKYNGDWLIFIIASILAPFLIPILLGVALARFINKNELL